MNAADIDLLFFEEALVLRNVKRQAAHRGRAQDQDHFRCVSGLFLRLGFGEAISGNDFVLIFAQFRIVFPVHEGYFLALYFLALN